MKFYSKPTLTVICIWGESRCFPAPYMAAQGSSGSASAGQRAAFGDFDEGGDFWDSRAKL